MRTRSAEMATGAPECDFPPTAPPLCAGRGGVNAVEGVMGSICTCEACTIVGVGEAPGGGLRLKAEAGTLM